MNDKNDEGGGFIRFGIVVILISQIAAIYYGISYGYVEESIYKEITKSAINPMAIIVAGSYSVLGSVLGLVLVALGKIIKGINEFKNPNLS